MLPSPTGEPGFIYDSCSASRCPVPKPASQHTTNKFRPMIYHVLGTTTVYSEVAGFGDYEAVPKHATNDSASLCPDILIQYKLTALRLLAIQSTYWPDMDVLAWQQRLDGRYVRSSFDVSGLPVAPAPYDGFLAPTYYYSRESNRYANRVQGPLGVYGVSFFPKDYQFWEYASRSRTVQRHFHSPWPYAPATPTPPAAPCTPAKSRPEKEKPTQKPEKHDDDSKSVASSLASWKVATEAPTLPSGTNYMFATEHTTIHVLRQPISLWKEKYRGQKFPFMIHKVSTQMSVGTVIQNVMKAKVGKDFDQCKGWAITEVIEQGDGKWAKVRAFGRNQYYQKSKRVLTRSRVQLSLMAARRRLDHYRVWVGTRSVESRYRLAGPGGQLWITTPLTYMILSDRAKFVPCFDSV
nr:hypothetical protein CFP56_48776 [Quercus suber]